MGKKEEFEKLKNRPCSDFDIFHLIFTCLDGVKKELFVYMHNMICDDEGLYMCKNHFDRENFKWVYGEKEKTNERFFPWDCIQEMHLNPGRYPETLRD